MEKIKYDYIILGINSQPHYNHKNLDESDPNFYLKNNYISS